MASQEEVNNQKELNEEAKITLSFEEQLINLLKTRKGILSGTLSDQQDISNAINDQAKQLKFLNEERKLGRKLTSDITQIATQTYSISQNELGQASTSLQLTKSQLDLEKKITLLAQQEAKFSKMTLKGDEESRRLNADIAQSYREQIKQAQELKRQISLIAEESKAIENTTGSKVFGTMGDAFGKLGMSKLSGPINEAAEAARDFGAEQISQNAEVNRGIDQYKQLRAEGMGMNDALKKAGINAKQLKVGKLPLKATGTLNAGFKALGPILKKALGPVTLIVEAVQAFMMIDKASGEIAKSMGISAAEGAKLAASSADAAAMSGDLLVSTKDVIAAQMELNQAMGTAVEFSGEFAAEFASIKERTGLSNEAMAMFSQNALVAGTSIKDQLSTVSAVTMEMNAQSGVMLNAKDIQEGIAKLSKAQQLTAGRNTKEMAKQVIQAKLLGASMQEVANIGDSLLQFESSIASEMEAELLTGKQLNLEKARMAALTGDEATLAEEIRKNVGTAAEFGEMNKIQQEALAKSFGMQRDQLAEMLMNQENLEAVKKAGFESTSEAQEAFNKLVEDGMTAEQAAAEMKRKGLDDAFTAQMKSETQQQKMNAAMEKVTDLFVQIIDPLMPVIDAITSLLTPIFAILSPIAKLLGTIVETAVKVSPLLNGLMSVISSVTDSVMKSVEGIGKILTGIFTLDFGMILDGFKSIADAVLSAILMGPQMIIDMIMGAVNGMIALANKIPGISIEEFGAINLSDSIGGMVGLAEGGIVTEPTTALIGEGGEPEAVTPLSKIGSFMSDAFMDYTPLGLAAKGIGKLMESDGESKEETIVSSPSIDIGPLVTQMTQMNNTLNAILAKEGTVTLDGTKVGTALTVASSKLQ